MNPEPVDTEKVINYINTEIIPDLVKRRVLTVARESGGDCQLDTVETKPLAADGTFMLTNLFKAKVVLRSSTASGITQVYHLAVKVTPELPEEIYNGCQFDTLFENETTAYTEIFPTLGKSDLYPKYFYSHRKPREAVMVLSDFNADGWKMAPMVVKLPLDYCLLAARELGRFHGECYALKMEKSDLFESIIKKFKESRYGADLGDMNWLAAMKTGPKRAIKAVRESAFKDRVPEEYLQKLGLVLEDPWSQQMRSVKPKEPLAVICHGDYLRNNIAFKYGDKTNPEKPTNVMMFDFQTLRYASPMIDFTIFIAISTGYDVREKHFETIFKAYHEELVQTLCSIIATNPNDLPQYYSYESFRREFAQYYLYGFNIASSFLGILYEPAESTFALESMSTEEIIEDTMKRGGPALDKELAAMVYELYREHQRYGIDPE
ncbi:uncharacterized protein LOC128743059 [Sabethes cyaneus]|uniref:uncharacterized protein LOC128743059 n=1 Tax=Sabethes cyaneus TaxID=53552 RepID=UPI00237DCB14|nr:uncharacterized protein LOC128743059 [Sabethes cyaneus]XP_053695551.1 uncharacterized protein LOC128743059 [Sabethes cyaneus]